MEVEDQNTFPKRRDLQRIENYKHLDKLYFGDHYKAFAIKAKKGFPEQYSKLRYIVGNFAGLMSRVMADMLFGQNIVIDLKDDSNQAFIDGLMEENHFITQLYESALANSRRGDSLFKVRLEGEEKARRIYIEETTPEIYYPQLSDSSARMQTDSDLLAWVKKSEDGKTNYLYQENHFAGRIENKAFVYNPDTKKIGRELSREELKELFNVEPVVETKASRSLIFHIPNVRDGSGFYGTSDYRGLEELFFALNNRITKIDNILDNHSDPILAVPPGVLDEKGRVKKSRLGMFEVQNDSPGFNKPEYITWNANLDSAFSQIDKIVDMLFMFSEISPATMGQDKTGDKTESGKALKFKLLRTIAKRDRKKIYYDAAIKDIIRTCLELSKNWGISVKGSKANSLETPSIKWGDGIMPDISEEIDNEVKRLDNGLSSVSDSLAKLDNLKPEDALKKAQEIEKANAVDVPSLDKAK